MVAFGQQQRSSGVASVGIPTTPTPGRGEDGPSQRWEHAKSGAQTWALVKGLTKPG